MQTPPVSSAPTFLAADLPAADLPAADLPAAPKAPAREYYELRAYRMAASSSRAPVERYLENALLPALAARGIAPVGVFTEIEVDPNATPPTARDMADSPVWVLIPHASLESFARLGADLAADPDVQRAAADYRQTPSERPAFARIDAWLLLAFAGLPRLELPSFSRSREPGRVFELRSYESYSEERARKKIAMFDDGEIAIMQEVGLSPVFYGEALAGRDLPHLTYLTGGPSLAAHLERWQCFKNHPRWVKMKYDPQYADTVSKITQWFLRPTAYSSI